MIIFDTDILSLLNYRRGDAYDRIAAHIAAQPEERACTTIISFEEQMRGWLSYIAAAKTSQRQVEGYARLLALFRDFPQFEVLAYTNAAAEHYDRLRRSRIRLGSMDLKIGAIALSYNAVVISRNLKDFRQIPNLRVEDWTK